MLKGNLTCTIVGKLLTHYVEDNLDNKCKNMVSIHLRNCPPCMEKYSIVKKLFNEAERKRKVIKAKERMQEEISSYLDGEMSEDEITRFEQKLSLEPEYEENLLKIMKLKKILNNSFYKAKYNSDIRFSKNVIEELKKTSGIKNILINLFKFPFQ